MAFIVKDRVKETTTTTGTGNLTLAGAVTGYRAFSAVCANGDTCWYALQAVDGSGVPTGDWEVGLGTWNTGGTLTRSIVIDSSNSGSLVSLAAGTKQVWLDFPAASVALASDGIAKPTYTVFDASMAFPNFILSPNRLSLARKGSSAAWRCVLGTRARSSGKYYFEYLYGSVISNTPMVGVGDSSTPSSNYAGADSHGWSISTTPQLFHSGGGSTTSPTLGYAANDICGVAVDFTASTGSINFYKNNSANGAYTSLTLGTMYPVVSMEQLEVYGTLRTTATDCTYSPPTGYSYWDS